MTDRAVDSRFEMPDIIRCIAICLLLTAHICQEVESPLGGYFGFPGIYFISLGGLAVTLFLIVSGAALELTYSGAVEYKNFFFKRLLRIYPVYYMSFFFAAAVLMVRSFHRTGTLTGAFAGITLNDVLWDLAGFRAFTGDWGGDILMTGWYIGLIMCLYAIYPVISHYITRHPHRSIVCLLVISFLSRWLLGKYPILPTRPIDWFPLCRVFEFALGIYTIRIVSKSCLRKSFFPAQCRILIRFVNAISFPLFLVHYPLLFLISFFLSRNLGMLPSIFNYLLISTLVAWFILIIDKRIPRTVVMKYLVRPISLEKA